MTNTTPTAGVKRSRQPSHDELLLSPSDSSLKPASPTASSVGSISHTQPSSASSFRNVSACNRCRLRKNRCDQRLPACASCEKARVKCVGYDPITKREIPRSYVYYLESRVSYLESLLRSNAVDFTPPENFALSFKPANGEPVYTGHVTGNDSGHARTNSIDRHVGSDTKRNEQDDREKLNKLVSNIGMVSVQGASDPRYLGSTSGISFARVVFAAVKSSVSGASSERGSVRGSKPPLPGNSVAAGGTSMRDSFFGLHTKPTIKPAPFPDRELGSRLVELYFEHANPQIPILHRGEFITMFDRVYAADEKSRTPRESYMLNIVFAIGAGIIMGSSDASDSPGSENSASSMKPPLSPPSQKKRKTIGQQHQPEEYHASAIVHLESFLGSSPATDRPDGFGGGLEELQAVLLLAGFALLRPVAPGLWYIIGVAVRLGVDLGLHYEDGVGIDGPNSDEGTSEDSKMDTDEPAAPVNGSKIDAKERGRRQWVRDLRRRLWWCVYSFDRLVSTCVGRPFGITDQVVTTEFPSLLDDKYITTAGFLVPPGESEKPSYKFVAHHYFRLRLLQSEILQVLQHRQAQQARVSGANQGNEYMHTKLPSPFLQRFDSFRSWRIDIDRRLWQWKEDAPTQKDTGVQFSPLFLELNYWQAVIMMYRQSLSVPPSLAGELGSTNDDVSSPSVVNVEEREDEEQVFLKVAEAGQKVLKLYRQLHRVRLVNYTFLATHHLFMAGISFLYAIWHSPVVRSHLSLDDVDFTVLAATSVLTDLIDKCPPAEACRDAFDRMSRATIQMCQSTTGFGPQALRHVKQSTTTPGTHVSDSSDIALHSDVDSMNSQRPSSGYYNSQMDTKPRKQPRFDMNLRDLFSDDETDSNSFNRISSTLMRPPQRPSNSASASPYNPNLSITPQLRQPSQLPSLQHTPSFDIDPAIQSLPQTSTPQQQIPSYQISNQLPYSNFSQTIQSTYPNIGQFSDLDFLDDFPVGSGNGSGRNGSGGTGGGGGGGGAGMQELDLGWMGSDGSHDWADGNGIDLFDGFFFGGAGAGGAY
ncbi:hypothetical protein M501DRAFT_1010358 [Patellaria atrata CBS 101060]|uniref:Zn(2)-C6 fungal-type domain-containing protein n=1 Tax=Patellaria atrata CBS 101060 TaxID=1346257 RepID=A0A9P4SE55_9PEZI|nr:hypothetical protein M501DRAFT_1010358 [Patellaria atrata CBS 101060]